MALIPFSTSRFQFTTDGQFPGYVRKLSGGAIAGEKTESKLGASNVIKKNITAVKYDDFTVELGAGMSKGMWEWINSSLNSNYVKKNFEYSLANANGEIQVTKTLYDCLVKEFTLPAFDASSKDVGWITLKIQPQTARVVMGGGGKVKGDQGKNVQKQWQCNSWRLDIAGLDCSQISKIDSLTWKQTVALNDIGHVREYETVACSMQQPDLKITLSAVTAKSWLDWHNEMVIKGNCDESLEKTGTLTLLHPNGKDEIGTLEFGNLGIMKCDFEGAEAGGEKAMKVVAELYCETTKFVPKTTDA